MHDFYKHNIAVVIPYYNASKEILKVVSKLPDFVNTLIVVNDKSPDTLPQEKIGSLINPKIKCCFLENDVNLGVGGATKKGFLHALKIDTEIVIKVDADDQMDLAYLKDMIRPLLSQKADLAKGNRFKDLKALRKMPILRRSGNLALSFLIKLATGYWHNFDPTNGFLALKTDILREVDFSKLSNRYYFETSLLAELYFQKAQIKDISMPAIYGNEKSNMAIWKMPFVFGRKLTATFFKRIVKEYFLYDFNIGSIYFIFGVPLFIFGVVYGIFQWIQAAEGNSFTPTGTIMIITLSIILGFQLLLQAIQYDIINAPKAK